MPDPRLEPSALRVIRAFRPATHALEQRTFANGYERVAYVGLLRKITFDAHAARSLAEAPMEGVLIAPHSPIAVLARSVAESAGQFARWFSNDMSLEERAFELLAAFLAGELGRLKHVPHTEGWKGRIQQVQDLVSTLTNEVEQHPRWKTLNSDDRKRIRKGHWKPVSKSALLGELGYGPKAQAGLYDWMSDAAHGGTRLLQQLAGDEPDVRRYVRSGLNFVAASVALLLFRLAEEESVVQAFLTSHPEVQHAVDLQVNLART